MAGEATVVRYPNGGSVEYRYDGAARLSGVTNRGSSGVLSSFGYERDASGNVTRVSEEDGAESTFSYDALDRLVRATYPRAKIQAIRDQYYVPAYPCGLAIQTPGSLPGGFELVDVRVEPLAKARTVRVELTESGGKQCGKHSFDRPYLPVAFSHFRHNVVLQRDQVLPLWERGHSQGGKSRLSRWRQQWRHWRQPPATPEEVQAAKRGVLVCLIT